MRLRYCSFSLIVTLVHCTASHADELALFGGAGPQAGSDQRNRVVGFEYSFFTYERSQRQQLQVGVAYARYETNANPSEELHVVSVFPQLTFYPPKTSRLAQAMPKGVLPYFYTRMLGPAYISQSSLGEREQANHFAFHAQIGAGFVFESEKGRQVVAHVSWRHLSNANLFSPNDGIDVPVVLTFGVRF
jgi:hypothetical protein